MRIQYTVELCLIANNLMFFNDGNIKGKLYYLLLYFKIHIVFAKFLEVKY